VQNDTGEIPRRNGLSGAGTGICGFVGLDGGGNWDRTRDPDLSARIAELKSGVGWITQSCRRMQHEQDWLVKARSPAPRHLARDFPGFNL
jgi:hypothetical protein